MKGGKQLGQTVQASRVPISRRLNMLGQHLTNQGFQKVRVRGRIAVEVVDTDGAKGIEHIDVDFSGFVKGKGPFEVGGDGVVELDVPDDATDPAATGGGLATRRGGRGVWDNDD